MHALKSTLLAGILIFSFLSACNEPLTEADLVITNVSVIDVENGGVTNAQDVIIIGDSVAQIHDTRSSDTYLATQWIDGTGKFLIPGLWDMHTHTWWGYEDFFPLLLANGVTGVREMFGNLDMVNKIKREIRDGSLAGPDIISAGPIICGDPPSLKTCVVATTPEEGRALVREQKSAGADFIKTYFMLENEVYLAIADECRKQNIVLTGHVPFKVPLWQALKAGHASIEHFFGILDSNADTLGLKQIDEERNTRYNYSEFIKRTGHINETYDPAGESALIDLLIQYDAWICPTFTVHKGFIRTYELGYKDDRKWYMPAYATDSWLSQDSALTETERSHLEVEEKNYALMLRLAEKLNDRGIRFLAGSDYSNPYTYPGFSLHEELEIFVNDAGFSNLEALQTATLYPALYLGLEDQLGTVASGKQATMVMLNKNPLENISHTRDIAGVILRGEYLPGDSLRREIDRIAAKNRLPGIADILLPVILEEGIDAGIDEYYRLVRQDSLSYNFDREQLNSLGYELLAEDYTEEAIRIFDLNTGRFPVFGKTWASLGEAYLALGDTAQTITAWQTAIRKGNLQTRSRLNEMIETSTPDL